MEVEGVPLKWHYPIGLLYDIHVNAVKKAQKLVRTMDEGYRDSPRSTNSHSPPLSGEESVTIPWSVTLHLRKFPSDKLIRSPTSQTMRDMHMAMADYIRHGSTKRVMDLSKDDQTQLLDGLESHSFEQYHAIQTFLSSPTSTVSHNSSNNGLPRNIPIRWHIFPKGSFQPDHAIILQDLIPPTSPQSPANMPRVNIKPVSSPMLKKPPNGAWLTLLDGFKQVYPEVFLPQTKETTESPTTSKETKGTDPQSTSVVSRWECWTQGIQPPWDAPLIWLSSNLSYLDGFLHIVLVETK
ncbi:autophagy protein 5 [Mycoemilia scoparia]|uniref:Autophagy protein 5 n=1 Tax=Mycoemilia scoparia TaxID=417184 RepID=A0A9W8A5T3_9FUNG|nr:autophagy protein 5 [Mycoemilia scoparia]